MFTSFIYFPQIIFNNLWNKLISNCEWYLLSDACSPTMVNNRLHVCMYTYVMFLLNGRAVQASTIFSLRRWLNVCSFIFIPYEDILPYAFHLLFEKLFLSFETLNTYKDILISLTIRNISLDVSFRDMIHIWIERIISHSFVINLTLGTYSYGWFVT